MQDLIFILLYITPLLILALYCDKKKPYTPHVLKINCANALVLFYMVSDHIGLLWLYLHPNGVNQLEAIDRNTVLLLSFYSLLVVIAYIVTGSVCGSKCVSIRVPHVESLRKSKIRYFPIFLILLIATPIAVSKATIDSPLLLLLSGASAEAIVARVTQVSTKTWFLGIKPSYIDIIFVVLSFVSIFPLVAFIIKKKIRFFCLYMMFALVVGLDSFSNISKGFIVGYLYIVLFTYSLIYKRGFLLNKVFWYCILIALLIVSLFSAWVMGNDALNLWYPFERLMLGNLLPQYVVVDSFHFENILYGTTVPRWFSFGLHQQFLLDVFAWKQLMGGSETFFYTAPSSFVAEAHANFHIFGVIFVSFFVFTSLRIVDYLLKQVKSDIIFTALMVHSSLYFSYMSVSGMVSFLVGYKYWAVLIFALIVYRIRVYRKFNMKTSSGKNG